MRCLHLLALFLALSSAARLEAQSASRDWRPEDRTVIGDFSRITAVAAAIDRVFAASPSQVLIWNPQFQQWQGPYDPPAPDYLVRVSGALVDPLDNSLWLASPDRWVHFQPELQLWDQGLVPAGVLSIAFDANDPTAGLFLRTRQGWEVVPRGGISSSPSAAPARPVFPARVDDVLRANPALQANAAQILLDARLNLARFTSAARSVDNLGWYLGTSGVGLLYVPDGAPLPERLSFGLRSPAAGAVFGWPEGVWTATNRTPQSEPALTFVASDLRAFRTVQGPAAQGLPFNRVRRLVGQGSALWAATDRGVVRIAGDGSRVELVDEARGLPDGVVYAVASRQGRITAGTRRGVVRLDDSLHVSRVAPRFADPATAVFPAGDSVWIGTQRGVLLALPGQEDVVRPETLAAPSLQAPVVALGSLGDTVVALTRDELLWRDPRTGAWTLGPNLSALLGSLVSFAPDGPGFWVAGDRGVGFARLNAAATRALREGDLPARSNDVAVNDGYLWVATDAGLVRFRLDAIRP